LLTADVRFEGWTTETWIRFLSLWKPRAEGDKEAQRPRGGVLVVHDGPQVLKVLHTKKGRLDPSLVELRESERRAVAAEGTAQESAASAGSAEQPSRKVWTCDLEALVREAQGSWGLSIQRGALEEAMELFGERARRHHDLTDQTLMLVEIIRQKMVAGDVVFWPQRLEGIPVPAAPVVRRAIDSVCADGHCVVLGLFENEDLWCATAMRRRGEAFDLVAGPEDIRLRMGIISGDFRRDVRYLVDAAKELYGPLSLGCFAEVSEFRALQVDPSPGAWSRAVALRKIVLSPAPTAVGIALGVDTARLAANRLKSLSERIDRFGLLPPLLESLRARASATLGDADLTDILGFSPLEVLRLLLRR
jgi:hypothetical protein